MSAVVDRFLALHLANHPVDATFMGLPGHDHELPPASPEALDRETAGLDELARELVREAEPAVAAERLERRTLAALLAFRARENTERPRLANPAWYTGEAAFGLVSLLLRDDRSTLESLRGRVRALPGFLSRGAETLASAASARGLPSGWVERARREGAALSRLLTRAMPLHGVGREVPGHEVDAAARAATAFTAALAGLGSAAASPSAGGEYLDFLLTDVHGLGLSAAEALEVAEAGLAAARGALEREARALSPHEPWREQLAADSHRHPELGDLLDTYRRFHEEAMACADAAGLVTPAADYGLDFRWLPDWAREMVDDLYFLFYRSPAAGAPGAGSVYWVFPPGGDLGAYLRSQSYTTVKITHAVHHGSIGHHTQNARARAAAGPLGRLSGTDCASGIAFLTGGTLIEGWACYVQDLLLEADGFYEPAERLVLRHAELRNAATCVADIKLHTGAWDTGDVRSFYVGEVGMPEARAWAETTRNSLWPSTRAMYWLGTRKIRELRRRLGGSPRALHDALLSFGSVPVSFVADELTSAAPRG